MRADAQQPVDELHELLRCAGLALHLVEALLARAATVTGRLPSSDKIPLEPPATNR